MAEVIPNEWGDQGPSREGLVSDEQMGEAAQEAEEAMSE
jgi:hypothetical protein